MKKLTAILLTLSLMLTMLCTPALAEEETNTFLEQTLFLGASDLSMEEWLASDESRAALVACLSLDYYLCYGEDSEIYRTVVGSMDQGEVFIGVADSMLQIVCFNGDRQAVAFYFPEADKLGYTLADISAEIAPAKMMEYYVAGGIMSEYYAVAHDDIVDYLMEVRSALGVE